MRPFRRLPAIVLLLCLPWLVGARSASDPRALKPGEFLWHPEIAPEGPIVLVVSLDEQRAYVYRNGLAIGVSTISSGKAGKETPTGVFTILQKNKDHRSNLYNNAPMPYMQRLTWDGIALHGGALPGYPASHGCVRLPLAFAEKLFAETRNGDTVVVADAKASPASLIRPALLAPVDEAGAAVATQDIQAGYFWNETIAARPGPVSVLVSVADRRVFVLRNGMLAGEAALQVAEGFALHGSVLMVASNPAAPAPETPPVPIPGPPAAMDGQEGAPVVPGNPAGATAAGTDGEAWDASMAAARPDLPVATDKPRLQWSAYPILGVDAESLPVLQLQLQSRPLRADDDFTRRVQALLEPGTTVLLTDLPAVRSNPAAQLPEPVLDAEGPSAGPEKPQEP
ncbi:L,D-transpeptidase [Pseudoxanthomonas sangjuensis]|uniref:L,D-transpeptidase n=1 Tax=Pseudoxanthomonas sangjuensis TaxID=1503750 RepID=UPI001FE4AF8A|nr:L,D-transpeptidase [Pseudoxanthomonas sangjuensis]